MAAVLITWLCYAIYTIGARMIVVSDAVYAAVFTSAWLMAISLWVPALALISVALGVLISARTSDPRTAQQLTKLVVVPLLLLFFAQLAGVLVISPTVVGIASAGLFVVAVLALAAAIRLFDREQILIKWSS